MKASSRLLVAVLILAGASVWASPARSQATTPIDTMAVFSRTGWEDGYLSLFNLDRVPQGSRMIGMGGAGLALLGGAEYMSLNPASIAGIRQVELESELIYHSGGASVQSYPRGNLGFILSSTNYRVTPSSGLGYNNVTLGVPLVVLGSRGGLGISYRRMARTGQPEETRVELRVVTSANTPVNYGRGDEPEQGLDAFSIAFAREMGKRLSLGATLNFESGQLDRSVDTGVSLYGFTILSGGLSYKQHASATSLDLGGRADLGRLKLAATAYLAHDLTLDEATVEDRPLPNDQTAPRFDLRGTPLDNTLSVPTMLGLGSAFEVNDRLTIAADYMIRPWSKAEITRDAIDATFGFADPNDSTTFFYTLDYPEGEKQTFDARFDDTNSLRLGLEYKLIERPQWTMPVRVGFRTEKLTQSNATVPDVYADVDALGLEFYQLNRIPAASRTEDQQARYDELYAAIDDVLVHNQLVFRGDAPDATVLSMGLGFDMGSFTAEMSVERTSYDIDTFFLGGYNPDPRYGSGNPILANESRSILAMSFSARWRF